MAGVSVEFDQEFFNTIMRSAGIESLCKAKAEQALAVAQANAPVKTGAYKRGLKIRRVDHQYRASWLVEGTDPKTMLVEARTGNLARALKAVKK